MDERECSEWSSIFGLGFVALLPCSREEMEKTEADFFLCGRGVLARMASMSGLSDLAGGDGDDGGKGFFTSTLSFRGVE